MTNRISFIYEKQLEHLVLLIDTLIWDSWQMSHKLHVLFRGFIDRNMTAVYNPALPRDIC